MSGRYHCLPVVKSVLTFIIGGIILPLVGLWTNVFSWSLYDHLSIAALHRTLVIIQTEIDADN